jgi:hypothetical protein
MRGGGTWLAGFPAMVKSLVPMALVALFALPSSARANDAGSEARFKSLDRNADGFVSRDVLEHEAHAKKQQQATDARRTSAAGASR